MIIGDHAVIPEYVQSGAVEWISAIPVYRVTITMIDDVVLELFTPAEKQARDWLKQIDKAIKDGAEARALAADMLAGEGGADGRSGD